ncbi:MAG: calcium-binding protein, partial [Rhodobacterales bacterium]|nr:calcium-binding protein [Rhodobacterales bacterium]
RFVFTAGTDRIKDFESGDDEIDLSFLASVSNYNQAMAVAVQSGASVVFNFAEGRLIVDNMRLNQFDSDDFLF